MNILPFHLNVPTEVILERPEGTPVQGRYGDRVMFSLADGRVMYVPPFVANKLQAEGVASGERFELCKTQSEERRPARDRMDFAAARPFEEPACTRDSVEASQVADGSESGPVPAPRGGTRDS